MGRLWKALAIGILAVLVFASVTLALTRIYQVDECQNVFVARLLASGRGHDYFTSVTLYLAPLVALDDPGATSPQLFTRARVFALVLFWVNIGLLAAATGARLRSPAGLIALLGAATLAPLWDYGFEVRHDNLLLTGLLLCLLLLQASGSGPLALVGLGFISVTLEFAAFKSFVYTAPLALAALTVIRPRDVSTFTAAAGAWLVGACGAFALVAAGYMLAGWWPLYVRDFRGISAVASSIIDRLTPWPALDRLVSEAPVVMALAAAACVAVARAALHDIRDAPRHPLFAPTLLLLVSLAAFVINPFPFPYNLVNVAPFAFIPAFMYGSTLLGGMKQRVPIVVVLCVAHLIPFVRFTRRHFSMTNARQHAIMTAAEQLTDPEKDFVYDGIGLVPTRLSINRLWYLHSVNRRAFTSGAGPRVRDLLAARPASVLIRSYRTDWLTADDDAFMRSHYVPLADDVWVLGASLPPGGGRFDVVHPGRYRVVETSGQSAPEPAQGQGLSAWIDGTRRPDGIATLREGSHDIRVDSGRSAAVVWLGPSLGELPTFAPADHKDLFLNWY